MTTGMTFSEYEHEAEKTALYPAKGNNIMYPTLGLVGEAGEVAEKIKKMIRDDDGILTPERREGVKKELGDVLWYIAALAREIDVTMEDIARANIEKLSSRKDRNKLNGDGDDR
jgi:NTP pyrophosphatase (non-canonical NTP hydrolase)